MSKPEFYLVVAGGRDFDDEDLMYREVQALLWDKLKPWTVVIVQGECRGADLCAKRVAARMNLKCVGYPADWNKHGRAAGPIRNAEMAKHGSGLLAFWDGESRGTENMISAMREQRKPVLVRNY